jgi:nucleotide-binding universal stress UspA family protein
VVVVPDGWKTTDRLAEQVVAGVDSPTPRDAALRFAVEFASAHGAGVQIVHVWTVPAAYAWDYPARRRIREQVAAMAQRHLDDVVREWRLRYPQVQLSSELRRAHRVLGLIDAARDAGAQLIVVGGHPRDDRHPPMLGPVARGVLHHAACPVAVVHEHHDDVEGAPPEVHGQPTQRGDR